MNAAIEKLVVQLVTAVRADVQREIMENVLVFGVPKAGKVIKLPGGAKATVSAKPRKKGPVQLCPVPNCPNRAAPSLGMVCLKHKAVPKAQIKKYRELRRAKKEKKAA